ncbi:MAG: TusE/DsrC/DsvC family sulfur relay protein [Proteobacteria bacterium]|nr:TusE/DsrC/DsvC family sulfur relay protein [Pseudomonadota bacterium]
MEITHLLDDNGHLHDYTLWNQSIAEQLANSDKIKLTDKHWEIIQLVRRIYLETQTTPPMRLLIKAIKINLDPDIANSRYLYQLFPDGPVRLTSKYAGLPKPKHCM